jgi:hypothetical protein
MTTFDDLVELHSSTSHLTAEGWDGETRGELNLLRSTTCIEMPYLDHNHIGAAPLLVTAASPLRPRLAAEVYGHAIKRECRYDFPLATKEIGDQHVWLLPSRRYLTVHSLIAGAVGFSLETRLDPPAWGLVWLYVHPYERGHHLVDNAWPTFREVYGPRFPIFGPFTPAGRTACRRLAGGRHPLFFDEVEP